jgi:hypothetical protein
VITPTSNDPDELMERGFTALVEALGWVDAVRFMQLYEVSNHDYTKERWNIVPDWDVETMMEKVEERRKPPIEPRP